MMLSLPVHEHGVCFHLLVPSSISSVSRNILSTGLLPPWLNLFLGILFIFDVIVNGIVFLVFLPDSSLLTYKNATDF